jgi:hypothetical protein
MLTIKTPLTIEGPERPFDTALFDVQITSRIRGRRLEPVLRLSLRRARKTPGRDGAPDAWDVVGEPVARVYPNIEAIMADLPKDIQPKVLEAWDALEAIAQAINDKHELV